MVVTLIAGVAGFYAVIAVGSKIVVLMGVNGQRMSLLLTSVTILFTHYNIDLL